MQTLLQCNPTHYNLPQSIRMQRLLQCNPRYCNLLQCNSIQPRDSPAPALQPPSTQTLLQCKPKHCNLPQCNPMQTRESPAPAMQANADQRIARHRSRLPRLSPSTLPLPSCRHIRPARGFRFPEWLSLSGSHFRIAPKQAEEGGRRKRSLELLGRLLLRGGRCRIPVGAALRGEGLVWGRDPGVRPSPFALQHVCTPCPPLPAAPGIPLPFKCKNSPARLARRPRVLFPISNRPLGLE